MKPRLLIVELHHLGDAVMSLPFVRGAMASHDVHILCRPGTRAIYDLLPDIKKIHSWEPPWSEGSSSFIASLKAAQTEGQILRPLDFDTAVCVWADARIEVLMAETQARRRIGFPMTASNYYASHLPWRRRRQLFGRTLEVFLNVFSSHRPLLTEKLYRKNSRQHHLQCWEQIADALGTHCDYSTPWFSVASPEPDEIKVLRSLAKPILTFHPHARLPSKQWKTDRWKSLLSNPAVRKQFALVEILPERTSPILADADAILPTPSISSLAAAFAASDFILCHDSLPAHIAAAVNKPVITIFGSGEPDWFAPWNNRDHVIQQRVCPLHPCIDRCGMDSYICMNAITENHILHKLNSLTHPS